MKLPPEVRVLVYEFAVQENIAAAMSKTAGYNELKRQPYLGALALVHTTSLIRRESRTVMHDIAHHQWEVLCAFGDLPKGTATSAGGVVLLLRCLEARKQSHWVGDVWRALTEPRRAESSHS
jgi:hypothetical protein